MIDDEEKFIMTLDNDVQNQGQFYDTDHPKEIYDLVQEDFSNSIENDKLLESYQTFEGTRFVLQNEDGDISSYFRNHEDQVVRSSPKQDVIETYTPKKETVSVSKGLIGKIFGESGGYY